MTITDRNGGTLTVTREGDRDYLRWLVEQALERTDKLKQEVADETGLLPGHISQAIGEGGSRWDYARVRIIEWWFAVRVESVQTITKWSSGKPTKVETFRFHPTT